MTKKQHSSDDKLPIGGGLKAVRYVLSIAGTVGPRRLAQAVRSKNTCKACAFGTGGQRGGLHNEHSTGIEICNKNIQAQSGDMQPAIPSAIFTDNSIEELKQLNGRELEALGRLAQPLFKAPGAERYRIISYDEAIARIGDKMRAADPQRSFFYSSGRSSNEAAFILQLFARLFGSNHVNNCSYYCHQASSVGLQASIGTGTATVQYQDLELADTILVIGANPASNHPRFLKILIECRRRGGNVIVINPAREPGLVRFASPSNFRSMIVGGAQIASHYVQPHVGGDLALLQAIAKAILEAGGENHAFITAYTNDFSLYRTHLEGLEWGILIEHSGVEELQIREIAQLLIDSQLSIFSWGMGVTHHNNGVDNIEAISNLALLRGMIAKPGSGLLPLRGHSNVQGVGSMGVTPALKEQVLNGLEQSLGVTLPKTEGMDTLACIKAAHQGNIDLAFLLGGNLYAATPDSAFAGEALATIPFKVHISSSLNLSHVHGIGEESIVLPIRVRDEEQQATTQESMFNFVRLSDGGFDRIESLRSEVDLICSIAAQVIDKDILDFSVFCDHHEIRTAIAKVIPGYAPLETLDEVKEEFHVQGRLLKQPTFNTVDGKANFRVPTTSLSSQKSANPTHYTLSSVRSEGQFNTIVYSDNDVYRGQSARNVVLMHPLDIKKEGFKEGMKVRLDNGTGSMRELTLRAFNIRQGNLLTYFPEANVLIPLHADSRSHTPSFKAVQVRITLESG